MVSSRASRNRIDMGQQSSQPQILSTEASTTTEGPRKSKSKDQSSKSKKSKRKSAEMEKPIDQDLESARALMQMRDDPIHDRMAPYYKNNHAASAQLMAESSPMRPSTDSYLDDLDDTESMHKSESRKTNNKKGTKKRGRVGIHEFTGSMDSSIEAMQYPDLPSTPPLQVDRSSPSPYRPNIPRASALDEIPTDDEDVAEYEEYAKDTASADPPGLPDHDIFSFSQQPPNDFDQDEDEESAQASHQLPTNGYALPQKAERQKKKKRKRRTDDETNQQNLAHDQGQHVSDFDIEVFDDFPNMDMSSANMFYNHEGDNMPIDPELHSMNILPASADTNTLNDEDLNTLQKNGASSSKHSTSQPRKRRRLEEVQGANTTDLPFMSPYAFEHDQENIQDQVLPGFEDRQGESPYEPSFELGSPFSEKDADGGTKFSGDGLKTQKGSRRKKDGETKKANSKKKREGTQKGDVIESSAKEVVGNGGPFSAAEGLQLDAFRENYCEANDMNIGRFNDLIQTQMRGNAEVTALFNEIHDILPYRPRMSVQKFCRRRFHNFSRGFWSAEEDKMLRQAVAEKGKAWKEVGDSLGRMADDCRDRWRNYIANSEHRNREQWTNAEVVNLCTAILECMQLMKLDRMHAREEGKDVPEFGTESDQEVEDMKHISWQAVSDRMGEHGGGRSRLQCSVKWGQLKKREQADYLEAIRESREIGNKKPTPVKNPWRTKLASKKIANMKTGDIRTFLQAVLDTGVPEEGNIPWKSIGDDEFRATWNSTDKKAAWSVLKKQVDGYESMDYRSVANDLLTRIDNEDADLLDERWDPEIHGDVSVKKTKKERKASKKKGKGKGKGKGTRRFGFDPSNGYSHLSNEFVFDSDDMDGENEEPTRLGDPEPQGYNRYNALPRADDIDWEVNESDRAGSMTADGVDVVFDSQGDATGIRAGEVSPELAGRLQSALNAYA